MPGAPRGAGKKWPMDSQAPASTQARGAAVTRPGDRPRGMRGSPPLTLVAVALGVMMVALDGTIVAVANPAIQSHLHTSLAGIQWVTNAYLLALAVCLITIGKVGDRLGHKKVFLTGVAGFALSSAAIGLSGSLVGSIGLVIAFRVVQGVFGAMLQPSALALLRETFPLEKLNAAIGVWGAVIGASTAAGPIVGGLLVQHIGWESCFYVNVPVGAVALTMSLLVLRETPPSPQASSFDLPGIVALSGALFLLIWGLIKASGYGWGSWPTLAFLGGAAAVGLLFVLRQSPGPAAAAAAAAIPVGLAVGRHGARRPADVLAVRRDVLHDLLPGERARPGPGRSRTAAAADDRDADRRRPAVRRADHPGGAADPNCRRDAAGRRRPVRAVPAGRHVQPERHHRVVPAARPRAEPGYRRRHRRHRGQRAGGTGGRTGGLQSTAMQVGEPSAPRSWAR